MDETEDMDEEVGESADSPPTPTTPSDNWTTTMTYDVYMFDMPCANDNGGTNNSDNTGNGANDNTGTKNGGGDNPDGPPCGEADDPQSDLGPKDEDILNESLCSPPHDALRRRLVNTAQKITNEKQRLREEAAFISDR